MKKILMIAFCVCFAKINAQVLKYDFQNNIINTGSLGATLNGTNATQITYTTDRNGSPNAAISFNGSGSKFEIPNALDYPQRTWALWVNATTIDNEYRIIFDADNTNLNHAQTQLFVNNEAGVDKIVLAIGANLFKINISANQWNHVALVRDSATVKFYFNGCLVYTGTDMSNNHANNGILNKIVIGKNRNDGCEARSSGTVGNCFQGNLDDLRVYNSALNAAQIKNIVGIKTCAGDCACGNWKAISITSVGSKEILLNCNQSTVVKPNTNVMINPMYNCNGGCNATYSAVLTKPDGTTSSITNFSYQFNQSVIGTYYLKITPKCGDKTCPPCLIKIIVADCDKIMDLTKEEIAKYDKNKD